jgi:hypothetical protein
VQGRGKDDVRLKGLRERRGFRELESLRKVVVVDGFPSESLSYRTLEGRIYSTIPRDGEGLLKKSVRLEVGELLSNATTFSKQLCVMPNIGLPLQHLKWRVMAVRRCDG